MYGNPIPAKKYTKKALLKLIINENKLIKIHDIMQGIAIASLRPNLLEIMPKTGTVIVPPIMKNVPIAPFFHALSQYNSNSNVRVWEEDLLSIIGGFCLQAS